MLPVNILIYYLDIKKANEEGVANWELVTDYVNDYKMTEMSPNGLYDLATRFQTDMELLSLFKWGKSRHYGHQKIATPKQGFEEFCDRISTTRFEHDDCMGEPHRSKAGFSEDPVGYLFDYLMGDWKVKSSKTDLN